MANEIISIVCFYFLLLIKELKQCAWQQKFPYTLLLFLQKHRRARAVLRFSNVIRQKKMSEVFFFPVVFNRFACNCNLLNSNCNSLCYCNFQDTMNKVFVPFLFGMLFDVQCGKGEHIRTACIEALASISAQMELSLIHI